jgi:predicted nucleic acid-binding protein
MVCRSFRLLDREWIADTRTRARGAKGNVLPDFFVGAHAAVLGWPILTRDVRRYRSYFPSVDLIGPAS